jgi:phosphatidylglycerophosphate synthase
LVDAGGWSGFYHRWSTTNSIAAFIVCAAFLTVVSPPGSILLVAVFIATGLLAFLIGSRRIRRSFRLCDAITSVRSVLALGVLGWLFALEINQTTIGDWHAWMLTAVLIAAEISDLLDGYAARIAGPTEFGAVWDMENDVAFSLVLCFLAYTYGGLGGWIVVSALLRHGYYLTFRFQSDPVGMPSSYKIFARSACAFQMIALISAIIPVLSIQQKTGINALSIVFLLVSFGWDLRGRYR